MGYYDVQQVCLNGHQITDRYNGSPEFRKKFCDECGEKTIYQCENCNKPIKGDYRVEDFIAAGQAAVPTHCENCGEPFPWTRRGRERVKSFVGEQMQFLDVARQICSRFHLVAKQLRSRYSDRDSLEVKDEYDVQDLLHAMLHVFFDDIRAEEHTPSYAGGSSRVDFLLKDHQIVVEVKKTRSTLKAKQLGEELIIDIARYKSHPDCNTLLCFVYDPDGWISNPRGLEKDLQCSEENFAVEVLIVPKGY